ncbi:hypothetical protein [Pseudomonas sp. EMN2]|nr:hypothetical protein [Pseudomonas sp. EMN2]
MAEPIEAIITFSRHVVLLDDLEPSHGFQERRETIQRLVEV